MKKLLNKKGFTLMEMLIVVAIIVILVAISLPAFSSSLDSAKAAADAANLRSAKAAYVVQTLGTGTDMPTASGSDVVYYDFEQGKFVAGAAPTAGHHSVGQCSKHADAYITVDGTTVEWSDGSTSCD